MDTDPYDRSTWTPEELEEERLEELGDPLFQLLLRFQNAFARLAIDKYDISDEDAEKMAARMAAADGKGGMLDTFAYLLRRIPNERNLRRISHMFSAIMATREVPFGMSIPDIVSEYGKLQKGEA